MIWKGPSLTGYRRIYSIKSIAGKVLASPYGKGSAAAPMVLLELVRAKKAPAALVQLEVDPLLVSGPIICKHFYGETIPVVTLNHEDFRLLKTGLHNYNSLHIAEAGSGPIVENGRLRPAELPGLGVAPDRSKLGDPVAVFT